MKNKHYDALLKKTETAIQEAFEVAADNFLGKCKAPRYRTLVENMLETFRNMGYHMSLKLHFLCSHLDFFPGSLGDVSVEHGEKLHQDISTTEKCYQAMLTNYCWQFRKEIPATYKRKASVKQFTFLLPPS
jgi:hypothetical protein